jgi:hypothetical protein
LLRLQHQKGLAEACQREHRAQAHHPPVGRRAAQQPRRIGLRRRAGGRHRLLEPEGEQGHGGPGGTVATQNTARKSFAHSSIRALAISGPAKAPTVSSDWRRPKARRADAAARCRPPGVARRAADALAHAVEQSGGDDQAGAAGQREQGLLSAPRP